MMIKTRYPERGRDVNEILSISIITLVLVTTILLPFISGCETDRQELVTAKVGTSEINIGDIESHGITVNIPAGSFKEETSVYLSITGEPLKDSSFHAIAPYAEIGVESEHKRTSEPITINIKANLSDTDELPAVYALYFNETNGWDAIVPDSVDREEGIVTFTTYHFSTYTIAELNENARVKEFINRKSVESWVSQNTEVEGEAAREELVREILSEGLGITDDSVLSIIAKSIIEELPGGKIATGLMSGDADKTTEEILKATAKGLAKGIKDSPELKALANEPGHVIATARAAAAGLEGDGQLALEHMAEHIVEYVSKKTPVVYQLNRIAKTWVKVVDHTINVWEYEEIEKAYQVYRDGASSRIPFWGYNVEPGNFDEVWEQMSGISVKITRDALQHYADARGINVDEISFEDQNRIREEARARIERQFKERSQRENEIDQIRGEKIILLEAYAEKGLLERSFSNPMYTEHDDLESLLRRITQLTERIKRDTGRSNIVSTLHGADREYDDVGVLKEDEILVSQLADLVWVWYNNGQEAYEEKLIELGLKEEDVDFSGEWGIYLHSMIAEIEGIDKNLGRPGTYPMTITSDNKVLFGLIGNGSITNYSPKTRQIKFTTSGAWSDGNDFLYEYEGSFQKDGGTLTMSGTGRGYINGVHYVSFSWDGTRN